jgi:hypothetical protein
MSERVNGKQLLRVIFLGRTGSGKLSSCSVLSGCENLEQPNFKIGHNGIAETKNAQIERFEVADYISASYSNLLFFLEGIFPITAPVLCFNLLVFRLHFCVDFVGLFFFYPRAAAATLKPWILAENQLTLHWNFYWVNTDIVGCMVQLEFYVIH